MINLLCVCTFVEIRNDMKILKFFRYALVAALVFSMDSCKGNQSSNIGDTEIDEIEQAVSGSSAARSMEMHVDSLALMADDLTPPEAVQVLVTYMRIHEDAKANNDSRRDLETMRKFVDVYDIVMSVNSDEMRPAFDKVARRNSSMNIHAAANEYRSLLADYGDGTAVEEESPEAPKQEVDSVKKEEPMADSVEADSEE